MQLCIPSWNLPLMPQGTENSEKEKERQVKKQEDAETEQSQERF